MGFGAPLATKAGSFKVICKLDTAIPEPFFDFTACLENTPLDWLRTEAEATAAATAEDPEAALAALKRKEEARHRKAQIQTVAQAFLATSAGRRSQARVADFADLDTLEAAQLIVISLLARDRWQSYLDEGDRADLKQFKPWAVGEEPPIVFEGCHLSNPELVYITGQLARPAKENETEGEKEYRLSLWVLSHCLRGVESGWPAEWPAPQRNAAGYLTQETLDYIPATWVPLLARHFLDLAAPKKNAKKA